MRRFHADHEGVMPDRTVLALWKCDEAASTATLSDSSYTNTYPLIKKGAGGITAQIGLFMSGLEGTPAAELPSGAFLRWLLDEGSGSSAVDSSGNSREGVVTDTSLRTVDGVQWPRVYPATGHIRTETEAESGESANYHRLCNTTDIGLTFSLMWKPVELAWQSDGSETGGTEAGNIIGEATSSSGPSLRLQRQRVATPGTLKVFPVTWSGTNPTWTGWVLNQEHHIVVRVGAPVVSGGNENRAVSLWADGVMIQEVTWSYFTGNPPRMFLDVGRTSVSSSADGCHVRDVIVWERPLTDVEIGTLNDLMVQLYA